MALPVLDHVVILVPQAFLDSPPSWLTQAFTLYPGGRHVDGATQNTLVLLPDGSYLEFIAFVPGADPALREKHRWGHKAEGKVVDWALSFIPEDHVDGEITGKEAFQHLQQRVRDADTGIIYHDLVKGGRRRLDGVELKWAISSPQHDSSEQLVEPGLAPFWCLDSTPRSLRVPFQEGDVSSHNCGASGVANIEVGYDGENLEALFKAILGESNDGAWVVNTVSHKLPQPATKVQLVHTSQGEITISFYTPKNDWAGKVLGGKVGEYELYFHMIGQ